MAITITSVTAPGQFQPVSPLAVLGYRSTRTAKVSTFTALNGAQVSVATQPQLRSGTLTFLFATEMDAFMCEILHTGGGILAYTDDDHPNTAMHYIVGSVSPALDDTSLTAWTVDVDYQEVPS